MMKSNQRFIESVENFQKIDSQEAEKFIEQGNDFILFAGRESCGYCRKFAPKLAQVTKEYEAKVYWLDTSHQDDNYLNDFREKYGVDSVPSLLMNRNNQVEVKSDSSMKKEEIAEFLKLV